MNDIIFNWLRGYPGMELLQRQQVDAVPGGCGLFFRGVTAQDGQRNLLGQTQKRKTLHFRLNRYGDRVDSPAFFMMLEVWLQTNIHSLGPDYAATLKNSRCVRDNDSGLCLWEAELEIICREEV